MPGTYLTNGLSRFETASEACKTRAMCLDGPFGVDICSLADGCIRGSERPRMCLEITLASNELSPNISMRIFFSCISMSVSTLPRIDWSVSSRL